MHLFRNEEAASEECLKFKENATTVCKYMVINIPGNSRKMEEEDWPELAWKQDSVMDDHAKAAAW